MNNKQWKWDEVTEPRVKLLEGITNPQVLERAMGKRLAGLNPDIWYVSFHAFASLPHLIKRRDELKREQKAIVHEPDRGLGLMGTWEDEANWYGGRIQQLARVEQDDASPHKYTLTLGAMHKVGRSHRLARFLGSRRVLQVRIPEKALYDQNEMDALKNFFAHKFVLCGRVFASFAVKDKKIYLVETSEDFERAPMQGEGDDRRMSLEELVRWYNPLELNDKQVSSVYHPRSLPLLTVVIPEFEQVRSSLRPRAIHLCPRTRVRSGEFYLH